MCPSRHDIYPACLNSDRADRDLAEATVTRIARVNLPNFSCFSSSLHCAHLRNHAWSA